MATDVTGPASTRPAGPAGPTPARAAFRLSVALAVVSAGAAGLTVLLPDVLRGPAAMNGSARGTALVMLLGATPLLVGAMAAARRGSVRGLLLWLGGVAYLAYNSVMLLLGTPFNALFPLYDAVLGLSIWSAIVLVHGLDETRVASSVVPGVRHRAVATLIWVVVAGNTLVWLRGLLPGLAQDPPAFLDGTGLTTLPTYVQDFAFWLPLFTLTGWWLWQQRPWGVVLAPVVMTYFVLEGVGVAVDQTWGHLADPASGVVSVEVVPGFLILTVVCAGVLAHLLRHVPAPRPTSKENP